MSELNNMNKNKTISMDYEAYNQELFDAQQIGYDQAMINCWYFARKPYVDKNVEAFGRHSQYTRQVADVINSIKVDAQMRPLEEELAA